MKGIAEHPEPVIATAAAMLSAESLHEAASLLRLSGIRFEETGFDNWDGGTAIWTIYILIDAPEYARVGPRRTILEEQIAARLKPIIDQYSRDWFSVSIAPKLQTPVPGWRGEDTAVAAVTRQNIFDGLRLEKVRWSGALEDVEFLQRVFDLKAMPSFDTRFTDAASDIWQHRVNNDDWDDDWVFGDTRFNLLHCPSEQFVRFLAEMVHPVVRPDRNEALQIVQHINEQLKPEGWQLVEEERIAGRPRFVGRRFTGTVARSVSRARTVADALDAGWMQKEIDSKQSSIASTPVKLENQSSGSPDRALASISSGISLKKLCPLCSRRPSVSTKPSKRSRPLIWADDWASSGSGGVIVSQNRMKRASVSALIPTSRSSRWTWRVSRSSLRVNAASIRSEPSGDRKETTAASTMAERDRPLRSARSAICFSISGGK